jgi:polyisoprenyl-teichoic acid--peptidoglycan teichoic acid transferase
MQTRTIIRRPAAGAPLAAARPPENKLQIAALRIATLFILMIFMGGGLLSGYLFYETVRTVVASLPVNTVPDSPVLPVIGRYNPPASDPGTGGANAQPAVSNPQPKPPSFSLGNERINVLLMGLDSRPDEVGPARSDVMMIVTVDPLTKRVGMLSIPRDLWVPIPGFGENRINTAYFYGEAKKLPGGGPALAEKTIQYNFGVKINYYIVINFVGFKKAVDALGGVTIDVPNDINDPSFPDDTYGYKPLVITKGVHHFNGQETLDYARTRHQDSDFGRMRRQQQVLAAVKEQALTPETLLKLPALWAARENAVLTDLTLDKIVAFAQLARDVKTDGIKDAVIDESMALGITTPGGAMVLWPDREKIRAVIDDLFSTPEGVPVPLPTASQDQAQAQAQPTQSRLPDEFNKLAAEGARIEISNGTPSEGLAARAADWLKSQGFNVVLVDTADRVDYPQTVVVESNNRPFTSQRLTAIFHVTQKVRQNPNPNSDVDIRIVIGQDFDEKEIPSGH